MKVTHIVPALFRPHGGIVGGAERYALELAKAMSRVTPTTLVSFGDHAETTADGPLLIRVLGPARYIRGLLQIIHDSDVIHCHQQHILTSTLTACAARALGKRVVVTDLGGGGFDPSACVSTDRLFHHHLHISQYSRKVFGHAANRRARVVYGGVDTEKFAPSPTPLSTGRPLYVGRLLPHKGVNYLIEAAGTDIPVDVVGLPHSARYLADLTEISATRNVRFQHRATDDDIVAAYQKALCIVLPSVYEDAYGNTSSVPELLGQTLLEGMACGLPAICTNVASMPEIVQHGITGFIVPPNDPKALRERIVWLRNNPEAARVMGNAARRSVVENFTWTNVVAHCLRAYANVSSTQNELTPKDVHAAPLRNARAASR